MRLKEPLTAHDFEEWTVSKTNPEIDDESARRNPMLTPSVCQLRSSGHLSWPIPALITRRADVRYLCNADIAT
jgi:hypothetical protein